MYQEQPFDPRQYSGSIADLITRPAEARAAAINAAAAYQARAAETSGQAYGGAIAGAGQAVGGAIQQVNNPERQLAQQQVDAGKRNLAYGTAVNAILAKAKGPDGKYDHDFLAQQMAAINIPQSMQADVLKTVDSLEDHGEKMKNARLEGQADVGHLIYQTIKSLPKDADPQTVNGAVLHAAALAKGSGVADDGEIQQVIGAIDNGTPAIGVALGLMGQSPSKRYDDLLKPLVIPRPGASVQDASGNVTTPVPERPPQPTEASLASAAHPGDPAAALAALKPAPKKGLQSENVLFGGKPVQVSYDPETGKRSMVGPDGQTVDVTGKTTPIPPASMQINPGLVPTGDALSMAARRYLATGELPSMGMGQAGAAARVAVMNEAAKIDPQASLSANAATFKADSANLSNLQKTEGTLSAFEKTSGKNLDQFIALAAKIPDTGVPWLNTPVRLLDAKVVGSQNMAAITAARDVALREIARVTNDPNLSGSLTDSARDEVSSLIPKDATLPQILNVAKVLKQDMANVHSGINDQIATVKAGLKSNPGAPKSDEGYIYAKDPQGVVHRAKVGTALPTGWVTTEKPN